MVSVAQLTAPLGDHQAVLPGLPGREDAGLMALPAGRFWLRFGGPLAGPNGLPKQRRRALFAGRSGDALSGNEEGSLTGRRFPAGPRVPWSDSASPGYWVVGAAQGEGVRGWQRRCSPASQARESPIAAREERPLARGSRSVWMRKRRKDSSMGDSLAAGTPLQVLWKTRGGFSRVCSASRSRGRWHGRAVRRRGGSPVQRYRFLILGSGSARLPSRRARRFEVPAVLRETAHYAAATPSSTAGRAERSGRWASKR